jgi:glycosyltransferase involved in cell wall biosynthesis
MDLISVIIPIYNVERYLHECVDSVINQTHKNLEIILVDDGSPDNCPQICDEYAAKDSRIKVVHKANGGAGSAWNAGLDIAAGDYIGFVDGDDYIAPDMYEVLLSNLKATGADVSKCMSVYVYKNTPVETIEENNLFVLKSAEARERPILMTEWYIAASVHNKIYKRAVFGNLRFVKICTEDRYAMPSIIYNAGDFVITGKTMYYYRQRRGSAVNANPGPKLGEFITVGEHMVDFAAEHNTKDLPFAKAILFDEYCHVMNVMITAGNRKAHPLYKTTRQYLKKHAWEIIRQKVTPPRSKIKAFSFWLNEGLYAFLWRKYMERKVRLGLYD